jgi:indolepyruvate ferredoxin oxidoreductase
VQLPQSLEGKISLRAQHLEAYQNKRLAIRYRKLVDAIEDLTLKEAVAKGYHKLLSYKDEYEVARLHLSTASKAAETFEGDLKLTYHLAPPMLSKTGADGRPMKKEFGAGMLRGFKILAKMKCLRGTLFDPFGRTAERRMERALIAQFEADMKVVLSKADPQTMEAVLALAELPLSIRGFGMVKEANERKAAKRREELLSVIQQGGLDLSAAAE